MEWFARWYARRIVNVNVNIILAGAMAIGIMWVVMHLLHRVKVDEHLARELSISTKLVNMGLSFVIDLVADLAVYYFLHWYANHMPRKLGGKMINPEYSDLSFMQDATKVQVERMLLSPVLYGIAMGLQYFLMHRDVAPPTAAAIGFAVGILTSRTLHTMWMLWEQRRLRAKMITPALQQDNSQSVQDPAQDAGKTGTQPLSMQKSVKQKQSA
jgi:putative flippase GtrA